MRRRIRLATVGAIAISAIAALSTSAGAVEPAAVANYSTSANGGFISLSLLNLIGLTGAGSSASSANNSATASGTGLCATLSESASTCPTTVAPTAADAINTTAVASETTDGQASDPAPNCLVPPLTVILITLEAACGRASASLDANGNPTAYGEGDLAKVTVGLGAAIPGLGNLLGNGTLCPSNAAAGGAAAGGLTAPAGVVSGLLSTVDSLLGTANLGALVPTGSDPLTSLCGIISGLTGELPLVGGLLSNATASTTLLSVTVGDSTSNITSSQASNGDDLVTTVATTEGVDIDLLGMLDIKILPNTASITVDTTTGVVSDPSAVTGILSVQEGASAPTVLALPDLSSLLGNLLNSLGLSGIVNPQLTTVAESATTLNSTATAGSAEAADLKLDLLGGLVVLNLGDAKVSASVNNVTSGPVVPVVTEPGVVTQPAVVPQAAVVPNVTTVHTGEFWAGSLPIFLLSGMGLAGMLMIGRRRVFSVARSVTPFSRRR